MTAASLAAALEELIEMSDEPPPAACSCHTAPPCGDCVEYRGMRDALEGARAALKAHKDAPTPGAGIGPEWKPCNKLPITVHVREQRQGEQHVSTREGITPVKPDDLIMRGVQGEEYPIGRELFAQTYRMGEAESAVPQAVAKGADRFFSYDGDNGNFDTYDTIEEAIASGQDWLEIAGDDGWPDGGPTIYYGAIIGEAREVPGSRREAGPNDPSDFDFIVEYEMCALAAPTLVVEHLDPSEFGLSTASAVRVWTTKQGEPT